MFDTTLIASLWKQNDFSVGLHERQWHLVGKEQDWKWKWPESLITAPLLVYHNEILISKCFIFSFHPFSILSNPNVLGDKDWFSLYLHSLPLCRFCNVNHHFLLHTQVQPTAKIQTANPWIREWDIKGSSNQNKLLGYNCCRMTLGNPVALKHMIDRVFFCTTQFHKLQ